MMAWDTRNGDKFASQGEKLTTQRKRLDAHDHSLKSIKTRLQPIPDIVRRLQDMENAMSAMRTAQEEANDRLAETNKRPAEATSEVQRLTESNEAMKERLTKRIDDAESQLTAYKIIANSKLAELKRLIGEHGLAITTTATNMENRFETAMVAIQEESRCNQVLSVQDCAAIRQEMESERVEVWNKINEGIESTDKRVDERLTNYFARWKELYERQSEQIANFENAHQHKQPPPIVDTNVVEILLEGMEKLGQALHDRIDVLEARLKGMPSAKERTEL